MEQRNVSCKREVLDVYGGGVDDPETSFLVALNGLVVDGQHRVF